ncbi:MAG: Holliday junction branch migration protein RuvA, partial [Planctomycetes bacterium]|nr:Holliday junction branch migration protein RuvA [Planctomycetota bacterium]
GWLIRTPLPVSSRIGKKGGEVTVLTHLVVREDALDLYGFLNEEERSLFQTLIGLSGVGPSIAMQILSSVTPQDFAIAVEKQDLAFFKKVKGIGPKKAKRLILDLKGAKMILPADENDGPAMTGIAGDAVAALCAMGVGEREAVDRVEVVLAKTPDLTLEDLIKAALR